MKFSAREDIEAPLEAVFRHVSDFQGFERAALRRGAEVQRIDRLTAPGPGMGWNLRFAWRGKPRRLIAEMTEYDPPNMMRFHAAAGGFDLDLAVDLMTLARGRTRMGVELDIRPKTIPARLIVQSMKLGKANLSRRFAQRVRELAEEIEKRRKRAVV